jgi:hypothetical protein
MQVSRPSPPIDSRAVIVRSPEPLFGDIAGQVVLLSVENGEYYALNAVGSWLWHRLETPATLEVIVHDALEEFDVEAAECRAGVCRFLGLLSTGGLVTIQPVPDR